MTEKKTDCNTHFPSFSNKGTVDFTWRCNWTKQAFFIIFS